MALLKSVIPLRLIHPMSAVPDPIAPMIVFLSEESGSSQIQTHSLKIITLPLCFSSSHRYITVQRERSCQVPDSGSVFALFLYYESHSGGETTQTYTGFNI